jgi:hypothetical protein
LLEDPTGDWPHVSITYLNKPGNYGLSDERWRYIEYDNGDKELYDTETDRYEWTNLAAKPQHADRIAKMRALAPTSFKEFVPASDASLPKLAWHPSAETAAPASTPDGDPFDVVFTNSRKDPVKVFWMDRQGKRKSYGTLQAGWRKPQKTRPGAVWLITDTDDKPLGHFIVGDRTAHAIVPAKQ